MAGQSPTPSELLSNLNEFKSVYDKYVATSNRAGQLAGNYNKLRAAGVNGYYSTCGDEFVKNVRDAETSLAQTQAQVRQISSTIQSLDAQQQQAHKNYEKSLQRVQQQYENDLQQKTVRRGCLWSLTRGLIGYTEFVMYFFAITSLLMLIVTSLLASDTSGSGVSITPPTSLYVRQVVGCTAVGLIIRFIKHSVAHDEVKKQADAAAKVARENVNTAYEQQYQDYQTKSAKQKEQLRMLQGIVDEESPQISALKPSALTQAKQLWAADCESLLSSLSSVSDEADRLHDELVSMGTIPDEADWPATDEIIRLVRSGRANTLAEALNLLDSNEQHRQLMAVQVTQLRTQEQARREGFAQRQQQLAELQQIRTDVSRNHNEEMAQRERIAAEASRQRAIQLGLSAAQLQAALAQSAEQRRHNAEVEGALNDMASRRY